MEQGEAATNGKNTYENTMDDPTRHASALAIEYIRRTT